jgi:thiol-disulfide isomerase/thioredoxin
MKELTRDQLASMKGLAVVEVYKPGCEPCEGLQDTMEELSEEYRERLDFYGSHFVRSGLGQHFGLSLDHVPTLVLLKDGEMVSHFTGAKYSKGIKERTGAHSDFLKKRLDGFLKQYSQPTPTEFPADQGRLEEKLVTTSLDLGRNSLVTLMERYLKKDERGDVTEAPEDMFRRVAENIASADANYEGSRERVEETTNEFYDVKVRIFT